MNDSQKNNIRSKIIGIIPSRYNSTRFPGKLLYPIFNKPLIQHTFENAKKSKALDDLIIATDDKKIKQEADKFNAKTLMTDVNCQNGTDRIIDAILKNKDLQTSDIIINIQGDHPQINANTIDAVVKMLAKDTSAEVSTAVTKVNYKIAVSENIVKCVFDKNNNAMYFSRSLIPYSKNKDTDYYYHIGIYAYRTKFLLNMRNMQKSNLQKSEDLEQLQILENGYKIKVAVVDDIPLGVDVFDDIKKVEKVLCQ